MDLDIVMLGSYECRMEGYSDEFNGHVPQIYSSLYLDTYLFQIPSLLFRHSSTSFFVLLFTCQPRLCLFNLV